MFKNIRLLLIPLFFVNLVPVSGLSAETLSWDQVLAQTLKNNPSLKISVSELEQAKEEKKKALSNFMPQITAAAGTSSSKSNDLEQTTSNSASISGSISLFSGFSDFSALKISELDRQNAVLKQKRTSCDIISQLKKEYNELLWAQEMNSLADKILQRRKENYNLILLKYEAGREDSGSLLRVEADMLQAEYELQKSFRYISTASSNLNKSMGNDEFSNIQLNGSLLTPELKETIKPEIVFAQTPEFLIARNNLRVSELQTVASRSSLFPEISASASSGRSGQDWGLEKNQWSTGINARYYFFQGTKNYHNIKIASLNKTIAKESLKKTSQSLLAQITSSYNDFLDALASLKVSEKYLQASKEQSKITAEKYMNGLAGYQDWYVIENDYINSEKSFLNAKKNAIAAYINLKILMGEISL